MTTAPNQQQLEQVCAPADDERELIDAFWRKTNHLTVGMICPPDNSLLRELLRPEHIPENIKKRMKDEIQKQRNDAYTPGMDSPEINNWGGSFGQGTDCN